jgi:hypothetical protein
VRAPEHDGVHVRLLQRLGVLADGCDRLGAEGIVALDQRHESRAGDGGQADARIQGAHELLVAAGCDGRPGREQPDPAVARRLDGGVRLRGDHADHRHRQRLLQLGQRSRGRAVAGDEDQLHTLPFEVGADLVREAGDLRQRTRPVG